MPEKKVAIIQSNYIPWKGYFDIINSVDEFIFYDDVQYTKNDWRNRNKIKTSQGVQWITVPVFQTSLHQRICDTEIAFSNWGKKHWQALQSNYAKAPFFQRYKPLFEDIYLNKHFKLLSELNYECIKAINQLLGIRTPLNYSQNFELQGDKNERLISLVKKLGGTVYLSGPAAKGYLDEVSFKSEGILVEWMDYLGYPAYNQRYPPFEHGVSIIDLIFNEGENATKFMKSFRP
jgi:hypothetical protein